MSIEDAQKRFNKRMKARKGFSKAWSMQGTSKENVAERKTKPSAKRERRVKGQGFFSRGAARTKTNGMQLVLGSERRSK